MSEKQEAAKYADAVLADYETLLTKSDAYLLVVLAWLQGNRDGRREGAKDAVVDKLKVLKA